MTHSDDIVFSLVCVVLLIALIVWATRRHVFTVFFGPQDRRDIEDWKFRIDTLLKRHGTVCLEKASIENDLFEMVGKMPDALVHPVLEGVKLGHAVERALRLKAELLGVSPPLHLEAPVAEVVPLAPREEKLEWANGTLVRKSR